MLNRRTRIVLCESLVLSKFNYCDTVYGSCIDSTSKRRIQGIQNACLRLCFGIRRRQSVSSKLGEADWLDMESRRYLHFAVLIHKIILNKTPPYLHKKIIFRTDVHNVNIRTRGMISPPIHSTSLFERSFSYYASKVYNNIPAKFKQLFISQFKKQIMQWIISK